MFLICKPCREAGMLEPEYRFLLAKNFGLGYETWHGDFKDQLDSFLVSHSTCSMGGVANCFTNNNFVLEYEQNPKGTSCTTPNSLV